MWLELQRQRKNMNALPIEMTNCRGMLHRSRATHFGISRILAGVLMLISIVLLAGATMAAEVSRFPPLASVPAVDIEHYGGIWYEIARYPNRFQRQCVGDVTASYRRIATGSIEVVNSCHLEDGSRDEVRSIARPFSGKDLTRLDVRFAPALLSFMPFVWGDYRIIDLAPDYSYAVIGEPTREFLWVLARSPRMDDATLARLLNRAATQGYDPTRAARTPQTGNE
jgi:apolipoprotein D and lipocalin family protein